MEKTVRNQTNIISERQRRALPSLLSAKTITEGYELAGISKTQYYAWKKQPAFKAEYERQSNEIVKDSFSNLKRLAAQAVETMGNLLKSKSAHVRFRAANAIIEHLIKVREQEDISDRIAELERIVEEGGNADEF